MHARFFRNVQDAPWYAHFLMPVLDSLEGLPDAATVLDIGTGAGKLIEMGLSRYPYRWAGADTDADMLSEARQRPLLRDIELHHLQPALPLPFADASFDAVTLCSVLFLLPDPGDLLRESWRVLRPGGRLVVLTPSGTGNVGPAILRKIGIKRNNWTFFLWRRMTAGNGRAWTQNSPLADFARRQNATYSDIPVFDRLAWLETVERTTQDQPVRRCPGAFDVDCSVVVTVQSQPAVTTRESPIFEREFLTCATA